MKNKSNSSSENINYKKVSSSTVEHSFPDTSTEYSQIENQIYVINTNQEFLDKEIVSNKAPENHFDKMKIHKGLPKGAYDKIRKLFSKVNKAFSL